MTDQQLVHVPIGKISIEEGHNPRTEFPVTEIEELANSIRQRGLLQPLVVREDGSGGYFLVAGERRLRACQGGTLDVVPCIVQNGRSDDPGERTVDALVENLQREDISIADEVKAYGRLKADHQWNAERIALEVGLPQNRVTKRMQLLVLPEDAIDAAATLNEKGRKALVAIARSSPEVAGELAKHLSGQSEEKKADFGKNPVQNLRGFKCTKAFALMAQDGQYDAADFLLTEEAHDARQALTEKSYGQLWVRVSDQVVKDADAISATVELADGKVILGWDACCQVAGDYCLRAHAEREAERKEWEERNAAHSDTGGSSSRVVVDDTGAPVEDEDEKKRIRSERHKQEVEERLEAQSYNDALGAALIGKLPKIELTAGLARLLSRLILAEHGRDYIMRGLRYCHPNGRIAPEGKSKVTKYVESGELGELLNDWLNGAKKADEILARTFIVLLCAEYADDRATARSNRGGQRPERGYYQAPADSNEVVDTELEKLLKKALPPKLFEQAIERARALARGSTFNGYGSGPDSEAPESPEVDEDLDEGLEDDAPGPGEGDADQTAEEGSEAALAE